MGDAGNPIKAYDREEQEYRRGFDHVSQDGDGGEPEQAYGLLAGNDVEPQRRTRKEHSEGVGVGNKHPAVEAYEERSEDLEGDGLDFAEETMAVVCA